ncbi:mechanosensitive ion channel family protein [Alteromonas lipolytica]|uniref:Mechanosensitive ion channel protein MscS n=1 Tax=Alteromonas lipolytica TaxID=1856405 RepID=A0A1E8FHU4_9ALTE|nr:mechanosensitive ion channel family protein [Alteromonas lipolytica]OFI35053.1 mechanosensitive ion channel protein MscS [Alteromonas lipolytica]GGF56222.1 mechanosensitive ion channel protein MscS [Alteromonas lipolytica]
MAVIDFIDKNWAIFLAYTQSYKLLTSLALVVLFLAAKRIVIRLLRRQGKKKGDDRRHSINLIDQLGNAILLVLLLMLWSTEVQNLALSIAAFMVAIVFATREMIQCFMGFIYYMTTRPFRVGDWVQLGEQVGEVVEMDWAKTTLLEVDAEHYGYTGKHVYVPNNQLMIQVVKNLNFLRRYRLHEFSIILEPLVNPYQLLDEFRAKSIAHCGHFRDVAERYKSWIERNLDAEFISIDPVIDIETNNFAKFVIKIGLFCPSDESLSLEEKIRSDWLDLWFSAVRREQKKGALPPISAERA